MMTRFERIIAVATNGDAIITFVALPSPPAIREGWMRETHAWSLCEDARLWRYDALALDRYFVEHQLFVTLPFQNPDVARDQLEVNMQAERLTPLDPTLATTLRLRLPQTVDLHARYV